MTHTIQRAGHPTTTLALATRGTDPRLKKLVRAAVVALLATSVVCNADDSKADYEKLYHLSKDVIEEQKQVLAGQDILIAKLREQRNDALKDAGPALPWYFWTILGGAATTILIRGVK